ncbi:uncharacterized protein TNCV_827141 [Trichonephila clavipes]|nr:uncharacterized protein TNCV_827141 [Trichonephila clavipes]
MFQEELDLSYLPSVEKLNKNYLETVKRVENFERFFAVPAFVSVIQYFCTVSIIIMDVMFLYDWKAERFLENALYLAFMFGFLGVLSLYAGDIFLEMLSATIVLLDKMTDKAYKGGLLAGENPLFMGFPVDGSEDQSVDASRFGA